MNILNLTIVIHFSRRIKLLTNKRRAVLLAPRYSQRLRNLALRRIPSNAMLIFRIWLRIFTRSLATLLLCAASQARPRPRGWRSIRASRPHPRRGIGGGAGEWLRASGAALVSSAWRRALSKVPIFQAKAVSSKFLISAIASYHPPQRSRKRERK
jgi:hypothetical protein